MAPLPPSTPSRGTKQAEAKNTPEIDDSYEELLRLWFAEHQPSRLRYRPSSPKQVVMRITIEPNGRITQARVARSSGEKELDNIALNVIHAANPAPALPKEYSGEPDQDFLIPFLF
jgi:TonB family protein